jgi:hypothetical protein
VEAIAHCRDLMCVIRPSSARLLHTDFIDTSRTQPVFSTLDLNGFAGQKIERHGDDTKVVSYQVGLFCFVVEIC